MDSIYLSWSRLRTHEECAQKGYLQRTGKKASVDNHRNFLPGNVTDRVVRDWLLDDPWNQLGEMPDRVPEYLEKALEETKKNKGIIIWRDDNGADKDSVIRDCITAVTNIEEDLKRLVLPYDYTPDYSFKSVLEVDVRGRDEPVQIVLNGYMDILVRMDTERYAIYDVKHTKDKYYWKKTIGQLAFYDTALRLFAGVYSERSALLQPLCDNTEKTFDITNDDRIKMWQSIQSYAQDYVNMNVEPKPSSSNCLYCNVKHACVVFKPKMTNGKKVSL